MPYSLCLRAFWSVLGVRWWIGKVQGRKGCQERVFMGIIMDEVRDEALNSVFKALLWGGSLLPLFYA